MVDENAIRRAGMLEAADICDDYADAQFALPYPYAEACGLAAQVLASKIRTVADTIGSIDGRRGLMADEPTVQLAIVRETDGERVRCIYVGQFRVYGNKPYVSEHLPHEFYELPISAIDAAIRFERKFPQAKTPKRFEMPDTHRTLNEAGKRDDGL